jgi:DnaJ-domain-containing protein 1
MGIGRRILDLARANLNALMERASKDQLEGLSEKELEAELERRRRERSSQEQERLRRVAEEAAAKSRGAKRDKTGDPRPRGAARRQSEAEVKAARLRVLYKALNVKHGAPFDEVKKSYRALMREHHPDRHAGDPVKQKAASDRAAIITTAYAELEVLLVTKKR